MIRGIDPVGLDGLADRLDVQAGLLRHHTRIALDLLHGNQRGADATRIGALMGRVEDWSLDSSTSLRWRAETIRSGQGAGLDIFRLNRAHFAAEAVFSLRSIEADYRHWSEQRRMSRQRVEEAVSNISRWLDQGWTDWDVTNGDLHNIHRTLEGLAGAELDQVIAALSSRQLERLIEEMGTSINGFSRDEKREVFSMLASNASGESLGKVHAAIMAGGGSEEAVDLGTEIHCISPDQVIIDFVRDVIDQGLARHRYSGLAPALAAGGIEDSAAVDRVLHEIISNNDALPLMLIDGVVFMHDGNREDESTLGPFDSLLGAATRGADPELKAAAFAALGAMVTDSDRALRGLLRNRHQIFDTTTTDIIGMREHSKTATEMLAAADSLLLSQATTVLLSDTNGVVEQLATSLDTDGAATTSYLYRLVDEDEVGPLGQIAASLRGGEVVDAVRFSNPGVDPDYQYPHAQNLGFLAGSLRAALERYADDKKGDINWIVSGAKLATAAVGIGFMKALEGLELAGMAVEGAAEWVATDYWAAKTQDEIDEGLADLVDTVVASLQPPLAPNGGPPQLGDALQWWHVRYDIVRDS